MTNGQICVGVEEASRIFIALKGGSRQESAGWWCFGEESLDGSIAPEGSRHPWCHDAAVNANLGKMCSIVFSIMVSNVTNIVSMNC